MNVIHTEKASTLQYAVKDPMTLYAVRNEH